MTETKQEKFNRMLVARLPKAVKSIELLANLSRKSDYEWFGAQIDDMLDQLEGAVDGVMDAFGVGDEADTKPEPGSDTITEPTDDQGAFYGPDTYGYAAPQKSSTAHIEGFDKWAIRDALHRLVKDHGPDDPGVAALRHVVLGWVPQAEED